MGYISITALECSLWNDILNFRLKVSLFNKLIHIHLKLMKCTGMSNPRLVFGIWVKPDTCALILMLGCLISMTVNIYSVEI